MSVYNKMLLFLLTALPGTKAAVPGTFFWKPRLSLDLSVPTTVQPFGVKLPTRDNIRDGFVVMIDGYSVGMTVISLVAGLTSAPTQPHLNPFSAFYYTQMYRWALRYASMLPKWMSGIGGNIAETHRTWRRRFYFMDDFIPKWAQKTLVHVDKKEWDREYLDWKRFKKFAEPAFGKHYRYPSKVFNNYKSEETVETAASLSVSSSSV